MRIVIVGDWEELADQLEGALGVMREIAGIAGRRGNWPAPFGNEILFQFCGFSRGCKAEKFPLGLPAAAPAL
jgi:hypothetical protein